MKKGYQKSKGNFNKRTKSLKLTAPMIGKFTTLNLIFAESRKCGTIRSLKLYDIFDNCCFKINLYNTENNNDAHTFFHQLSALDNK